MQVKEDIGKHHHHAVAAVARRGMAKNALPDLGISDEITDRHVYSIDRKGHYTLMNESALVHSPRSCWNLRLLSTTTWPSSPTPTAQRSRGRGAGPSKLMPGSPMAGP